MRTQHRRGFILVAVLWVGALLIALAAVLLQQSRIGLVVARSGINEVAVDAVLSGALELVVSRIPPEPAPSSVSGKLEDLTIAGGKVSFAVLDASGLIDLNTAPPEMIARVGEVTGDQKGAAIILDRRNEPGKTGKLPWRAPAELLDTEGLRPAFAAALSDYGTVFSPGQINPLTAPLGVLALMPGFDRNRALGLLRARSAPGADPEKIVASLGDQTGTLFANALARVYDVYLEAETDGLTKTARATISVAQDGAVPYRLLDWQAWAARPAWLAQAR